MWGPTRGSHLRWPNLEYGASAVFPCGWRGQSIRNPGTPHWSTWRLRQARVSSGRYAIFQIPLKPIPSGLSLCGGLPGVATCGGNPWLWKPAPSGLLRANVRRARTTGCRMNGSSYASFVVRIVRRQSVRRSDRAGFARLVIRTARRADVSPDARFRGRATRRTNGPVHGLLNVRIAGITPVQDVASPKRACRARSISPGRRPGSRPQVMPRP